jgi:dTMP kinase
MNAAGKFISLEGIEGAGKSTLARALEVRLVQRGLAVQLTREPGGTPLAERLRALVLERGAERISAEAETLLMFAARAVHVENLIRPALSGGAWVICDRFTDATRAYQGAGRGVDCELIERLANTVHGNLWPHRTLLLDLPVETGLTRARTRAEAGDRFEDEDRRFFERVRARYRALAALEPARIRVLDAAQTPDSVAARALEAIADLLPPSTAASERGAK